MTVVERFAFIVLGLILTGWLYWLTARIQGVLSQAEAAIDTADRVLWAQGRTGEPVEELDVELAGRHHYREEHVQ